MERINSKFRRVLNREGKRFMGLRRHVQDIRFYFLGEKRTENFEKIWREKKPQLNKLIAECLLYYKPFFCNCLKYFILRKNKSVGTLQFF